MSTGSISASSAVIRIGDADRTTHRSIDVAVTKGFCDRRPRDQAAQVAPMHVAGGIIIGVEKIGVLRNVRLVSRHPNFQHERLEKPARVREVPFRRAHIRHRLHDAIFRLQISAKARAEKFRTWRNRSIKSRRAFRFRRRLGDSPR